MYIFSTLANNEKTNNKKRKATNKMGAHERTAQNISNLNMFLTNGKGYGPVDPARLADWRNFVAAQNRDKTALR
jgi:hypothetical protein